MKNTQGYHYLYADGTEVWSREPMTASELTEHKAYVDANSAYIEAHSEEYDPDPEQYYTLGAPRMNWSL